MKNLAAGDAILVPVRADPGAFTGEYLITVETRDGPTSGFIDAEQVVHRNGRTFVRVQVLDVGNDWITVRLHGSFFTTSGLAHIGKDAPYLRAA